MKKLNYSILLLLIFFLIFSSGSAQNLNTEIILPYLVRTNDLIPIVVKVYNNDQSINTSINGSFQLITNIAALEDNLIKIKHGKGSKTTKVLAEESFTISIESLNGQTTVLVQNESPVSNQNGQIAADSQWTSDSIYHIVGDIILPAGIKLTIEEGTKIYLDEKVNIIINGSLQIIGSSEKPVIFQPFDSEKFWGGIRILNGSDSSFCNHGFFLNGGSNEQFVFGHSNSQPVLFAENSVVNIYNSYILDNPGKALGGLFSLIKINNCLISRCDTGGEYENSSLNIIKTWFVDFPSDDGIPVDDDNDAIYFYGVHPSLSNPSIIDNCVFITGKDDGIDHNGANLEIKNCRIEGFYHEGIAASNTNNLTVFNTLIKDCEQGIEAGYGEPKVNIDHCVMINNSIGLRFGDSYDWGCGGLITATNSILFENDDNILNYDILTQGPVAGAILISYSMTNDPDYNDFIGCISGIPLFDSNYLLLPGSPGIGMATNGGNLGLIDTSLGCLNNKCCKYMPLTILPNPINRITTIQFTLSEIEDLLVLKILNSYGDVIYTQEIIDISKGNNSFNLQLNKLSPGFYFFGLFKNNDLLAMQKAIKL